MLAQETFFNMEGLSEAIREPDWVSYFAALCCLHVASERSEEMPVAKSFSDRWAMYGFLLLAMVQVSTGVDMDVSGRDHGPQGTHQASGRDGQRRSIRECDTPTCSAEKVQPQVQKVED